MKLTLSKNGKFIQITPKPIENISFGLRVYLKKAIDEYHEPIAGTDLIKGRSRYYLPEEMVGNIISIEI